MTITAQGVQAIQSAGQAVHGAEQTMRAEFEALTGKVNAALLSNPYDIGNDTSFEQVKKVARITQALTEMEGAIRNLYALAVEASPPPVTKKLMWIGSTTTMKAGFGVPTDVLPKKPRSIKTPVASSAHPDTVPAVKPAKRKYTRTTEAVPVDAVQDAATAVSPVASKAQSTSKSKQK